MTARENELQTIVGDRGVGFIGRAVRVVIDGRQNLKLGLICNRGLHAPQAVDGAPLGNSHQPGAGIGRHHVPPLAQGFGHGVLVGVFGEIEVVKLFDERGLHEAGFGPHDRFERVARRGVHDRQ